MGFGTESTSRYSLSRSPAYEGAGSAAWRTSGSCAPSW